MSDQYSQIDIYEKENLGEILEKKGDKYNAFTFNIQFFFNLN